MVSTPLIIILALVLVGVTISYITLTLTGEEHPKIEKPTFIDFSLKQEGSSILIQNTGINNISAESLKVYLVSTLTQVTNKNNIPPGSTYTVKISELPSFEGKINITIALGNVNRSLEVVSIREVTTPVSEVFPKPAETTVQPTPSVKIYSLSIGTIGGGEVIVNPNASEFEEGTEVEVNATADKNHTFGYWMMDNVVLYWNKSQIVKMDKNHSLTAVFLIRSDIDCVRYNPSITIANATPQSNISMTYLVNVTNRDYKCGLESFELRESCPSVFVCNFQNRLISIESGNSSTTTDFFMSPKNVTALNKGNYSFSITVKNRAATSYSSMNSTFYEIK